MKLPDAVPPSRATPWRLALLSTCIAVFLSFILHQRWAREIRAAPVDLPIISHVFAPHPELLPFDASSQGIWESLNLQDWWDTEWRDPHGATTHRGFHMFHMIHCLGAI